MAGWRISGGEIGQRRVGGADSASGGFMRVGAGCARPLAEERNDACMVLCSRSAHAGFIVYEIKGGAPSTGAIGLRPVSHYRKKNSIGPWLEVNEEAWKDYLNSVGI